jgi:hypothetical protein
MSRQDHSPHQRKVGATALAVSATMLATCAPEFALPPGAQLNTPGMAKPAGQGSDAEPAGSSVEWLVSRNRRRQCGDASRAMAIVREASAARPDGKGSAAEDPYLREIAGQQATSNPAALWGRWAVELHVFKQRCRSGLDEAALHNLAATKLAYLEEGLIADAGQDCSMLLALVRTETWPFPYLIIDDLLANKLHDAEVSRQMWIQALGKTSSGCAERLTDRDKTSIRVHAEKLERMVTLADDMLIDLRKRLSVAIAAGKTDEAAALASAISQREESLDTRQGDERVREARRRESQAKVKQATAETQAAQAAAAASDAVKAKEENSSGWIHDIFQGFGEGVGRAVSCRTRGFCGY